MLRSGFYTEEHEQNFRVANQRVRRGGANAEICGARTRTGSVCQMAPLKGSRRCLRHAGPKAANEYRERQKEQFLSGRLSWTDWTRAEAKRAANRLREKWKRDRGSRVVQSTLANMSRRSSKGAVSFPETQPPLCLRQ